MTELVSQSTLNEYEEFVSSHPKGHFMQSVMWARQKPEWKWEAIVCRGNNGAIKGSLALLIRKMPGVPYTLMYGCRGPVCDPLDKETLAELIKAARELAKKYRSYVIKLDPDIPSSDTEFQKYLESLGFKSAVQGKGFESIQPRYVFRNYIAGMTEEEVLASFHSKTRYNIRLARRKGVTVEIKGPEAMPEFAALMLETGLRDGFVTRPQSYFEDMQKNLGEHMRLYMAYYDGRAVAGTIAIWYGDKVWYLYGASANEYRNIMPNYLCQWEMIRWAIEKKCRIYDFRGVSGDLSEDNPLYGLYRFKKGFNGEFTEFIGEMDLILKPFVNFALIKGQKLYKKLMKAAFMRKNAAVSPKSED